MRSGATGERQRDQLNGLVHDSRKSAFSALGVATNDCDVNSVLIDRGDGFYVHLIWRAWLDGRRLSLSP